VNSPSAHASLPSLRYILRLLQVAVDLVVLAFALVLALALRFEGDIPREMLRRVLLHLPFIIGLQFASLMAFGSHRTIWRYFTFRDASRIARGLLLASFLLLAYRTLSAHVPELRASLVPFGVLIIDAVLAFVGLIGVRAVRRFEAEASERRARRPTFSRTAPVLLVGAGRGGAFLARELRARPDQGYQPVGFVDDDPRKVGQEVDGLPVLGTTRDLSEVCKKYGISRLIITVASTSPSEFRDLSDRASVVGLPVMFVPRLVDFLDGASGALRIRDVTIEDLLGRPPVSLDLDGLGRLIRDQVVLVSGAGGSIGSELCRQIVRFHPSRVILVERFENALFEIHRELLETTSQTGIKLVPRVCDTTDVSRVDQILHADQPALVLHAAAHKHVPMMELNPGEAVKNNVGGTRVLADAAVRHGVGRFVMISTDKAVNPTSIMGATKRVAELYVQMKNGERMTRFSTVRFGNVLGSAGSVVPIFKKQIAKGGPVTVTHPDMVRFFMTIPEACQLVLQAGAFSKGGEIYVLDMGAPVRIVDLARDLIRLSGFRPDQDITIEYTGIRPGEKLYEELSLAQKENLTSLHPGIFVVEAQPIDAGELGRAVESLLKSAQDGHADDIVAALRAVVPEFRAPSASQPGRSA
jgi:FlaA1/EpsC-like NDP-sugar epimerase